MQTVKCESTKLKICFNDKLTLAHLIHELEQKFSIQLFDDKDDKSEDILIVGKKK